MTELIDYYNGMSLEKKEGQLVTHRAIAEKPLPKKPEKRNTLSGFSVYCLFGDPGITVLNVGDKVAGFSMFV